MNTVRKSSGGSAVMTRRASSSGQSITARRLQPVKQLSSGTESIVTPRGQARDDR